MALFINSVILLSVLFPAMCSRHLQDLHVVSAVSQPYDDFTEIPQLPADVSLPVDYYDTRHLFGWNRHVLEKNLLLYQNKDKKTLEAVSGLIYTADNILAQPVYDVTNKTIVVTGADPRYYMSLAQQWWKIGDTYVRKNNVNPEVYTHAPNAKHLRLTMEHVGWLGLAWYFTKDECYSRRAKEKISTWFLDPDKSMYPNLKYAQIVPGSQIGSPQGVLEMSSVIQLFNGVALISNSNDWSPEDDDQLAAWFSEYLVWLENDSAPTEERKSVDHHGTWFDAQIMAIYTFLNRPLDAARIAYFGRQRLDYQVSDRTMMYEIVDGQGLEHVQRNLEAWVSIAEMAGTLGIDVWNYGSNDGHSFKGVFDAFKPYWRSLGLTWPYFSANPDVRIAAELTPRMYMGYSVSDYTELNIDIRAAFSNVAQKYMGRAKVLCYVPLDSEFSVKGIILERTCWSWKCEYLKITVVAMASGVILSFTACTIYNHCRRKSVAHEPSHVLDASFLEALSKYEDLLNSMTTAFPDRGGALMPSPCGEIPSPCRQTRSDAS
jgi:hypothetical protein